MLGHDVHGNLAQIKVGTDTCRGRDARLLQDMADHRHGQFVCRHAVGQQIRSHIDEDLVDAVHMNILRCDILQVNLIDPPAVFDVISHPGRSHDVIHLPVGMLFQRPGIAGLAG